jgi:hypothetical protein
VVVVDTYGAFFAATLPSELLPGAAIEAVALVRKNTPHSNGKKIDFTLN